MSLLCRGCVLLAEAWGGKLLASCALLARCTQRVAAVALPVSAREIKSFFERLIDSTHYYYPKPIFVAFWPVRLLR